MSASSLEMLRESLSSRWSTLLQRERLMVSVAVVFVVAALLWWVAISPALLKLRKAQEAAPQLDAQLQLMRAQASEVTSLKAQRSLGYDESLRGLENSIKTLGPGASLNVSDARASITLRAVSGDALAQWLSQVRANARLVPSELRLKKSATPTTSAQSAATSWDGSIVLNLPAR
jgi:general secretion pathway protein M